MISIGAYVIILPDKKYFNTADFTDYGSIEVEITSTAPVTFFPCKSDGSEYVAEYIQSEERKANPV